MIVHISKSKMKNMVLKCSPCRGNCPKMKSTMTRSMLRLRPLQEKTKMMIRMVNWLKKSKIARVRIDAMRIDPRIEMVNAVATAKIEMIVIAKGAKIVIVTVTVTVVVIVIVVAMTRSAKNETGVVTTPNAIKTAKKIVKRTTKVAVKSAESCTNTHIEQK